MEMREHCGLALGLGQVEVWKPVQPFGDWDLAPSIFRAWTTEVPTAYLPEPTRSHPRPMPGFLQTNRPLPVRKRPRRRSPICEGIFFWQAADMPGKLANMDYHDWNERQNLPDTKDTIISPEFCEPSWDLVSIFRCR